VAGVIGAKMLLQPKAAATALDLSNVVSGSTAPQKAEAQLDQALAEKRVTFALFHSLTCIPCKEMEKVARDVMPAFKDRVTFVDVNVYDQANVPLLRRMGISTIPTTYVFGKDGTYQRFIGVITRDTLRTVLQTALSQ
jgi:thiol:disulfide interchange protein